MVISYINNNIKQFTLLGIHSAAFFHGLGPFFYLIIGPILVYVNLKVNKNSREMDYRMIFAISFVCLAIAYGILFYTGAVKESKAMPLGIIPFYFFFALSDYLFSPSSMSSVTRLAAPNMINFIMGVWLMSISIAYYLSGKIVFILSKATAVGSTFNYISSFKHLMTISLLIAALNGLSYFLTKHRTG